MIYTDLTVLALKTAFEAHKGQTDRSGLPYIFHPYHLAEQMKTEDTAAAALLHDVVEDTDMTLDDLKSLGFPDRVLEAVKLLTHEEGTDYFDYVRKIKTNQTAVAVKLADLEHNSDLTRLSEVTENDLLRLEKYRKAKDILLNDE